MGAYSDFVMNADGTPIAGICHARGANADLPPVWLIYITVDDLDHSLDECQSASAARSSPRHGATAAAATASSRIPPAPSAPSTSHPTPPRTADYADHADKILDSSPWHPWPRLTVSNDP